MISKTPSIPRRAFTLTELLAVIALIALLALIAAPALTNLLASSQRSLAENQLRVGLTAGRDAAIRSERGDGASAFLFRGGRIVIIPCVSVGFIDDAFTFNDQGSVVTSSGDTVRREVFVPVPGIEPAQMPLGYSVRGYATPGSLNRDVATAGVFDGWYDSTWLTSSNNPEAGNWVFPETSFYDQKNTLEDDGWKRQSFLVRFEAQTGHLVSSEDSTVLVVDAVSDDAWRYTPPFTVSPTVRYRTDEVADLASAARRWLADSSLSGAGAPTPIQKILGDLSPDTILCRAVTELALYDEERMALTIGASRLNRATGTIYADPAPPQDSWPTLDTSLFASGATEAEIQESVNMWIVGDKSVLPAGGVSEARIFSLTKYMGQIQEISP